MAHADLEAAEQAAESVRVPGVAGAGLGVAIALAGTIGAPLLIPFGLLIAGAVGTRHPRAAPEPRRQGRRRRAGGPRSGRRAELPRVPPPTRRRHRRSQRARHRRGRLHRAPERHGRPGWSWSARASTCTRPSPSTPRCRRTTPRCATSAAPPTRSSSSATDLARHAEPAVVAARAALAHACAAYGLTADDLADPTTVDAGVEAAIRPRPAALASKVSWRSSEAREQDAARQLGAQLLQLGFDAGDLDARLGALEWAVARAANARRLLCGRPRRPDRALRDPRGRPRAPRADERRGGAARDRQDRSRTARGIPGAARRGPVVAGEADGAVGALGVIGSSLRRGVTACETAWVEMSARLARAALRTCAGRVRGSR